MLKRTDYFNVLFFDSLFRDYSVYVTICIKSLFQITDIEINFLFATLSKHFLPPRLFKVYETGNYTFYVACDDVCELWLHTGQQGQFAVDDENEETGKVLLAKLDYGYWTDHNQWDK